MIKPLLQDILKPATARLLETIDIVMNSNTMLLKGEVDPPLVAGQGHAFLDTFLRSVPFFDMFLNVDDLRGLFSYLITVFLFDMDLSPSILVKEDFLLHCTPMDAQAFAQRLDWMFRFSLSPYQKHLSALESEEIIGAFWQEVFGPQSWPLDLEGSLSLSENPSWSFLDVQPNFLYNMNDIDALGEGADPPFLYYFSGSYEPQDDTCTLFYRDNIFYLLLTCGFV